MHIANHNLGSWLCTPLFTPVHDLRQFLAAAAGAGTTFHLCEVLLLDCSVKIVLSVCKIISVTIQQLSVIFAVLDRCFLVLCCHIRGDGRVCFCCRAVGSRPPAWQTSTRLWCPAALNTWTPAGINKVWHYWMCHLPICFCAGRCQQRVMFVSLSSDAVFRLSWAWAGKHETFFFFFFALLIDIKIVYFWTLED